MVYQGILIPLALIKNLEDELRMKDLESRNTLEGVTRKLQKQLKEKYKTQALSDTDQVREIMDYNKIASLRYHNLNLEVIKDECYSVYSRNFRHSASTSAIVTLL